MFFSVNDLYNFLNDSNRNADFRQAVLRLSRGDRNFGYDVRPTRREVAKYVKAVKRAIINRQATLNFNDGGYGNHYIAKWLRPWDVVPALKNFNAPDGDYAVGVEIEMGFTSRQAAHTVATHVANWRHIALDWEGGDFPIEATFPPVLYSKFGSKSQPSRYLKWLSANQSLVQEHREDALVGTHINVSKGRQRLPVERVMELTSRLRLLSDEQKSKYFGRRVPYSYARPQSVKYIEFKMFNSTTNWKILRRYVDISVALAELVYSGAPLSDAAIYQALEEGYNKRSRKRVANVSAQEVQSELALAA